MWLVNFFSYKFSPITFYLLLILLISTLDECTLETNLLHGVSTLWKNWSYFLHCFRWFGHTSKAFLVLLFYNIYSCIVRMQHNVYYKCVSNYQPTKDNPICCSGGCHTRSRKNSIFLLCHYKLCTTLIWFVIQVIFNKHYSLQFLFIFNKTIIYLHFRHFEHFIFASAFVTIFSNFLYCPFCFTCSFSSLCSMGNHFFLHSHTRLQDQLDEFAITLSHVLHSKCHGIDSTCFQQHMKLGNFTEFLTIGKNV